MESLSQGEPLKVRIINSLKDPINRIGFLLFVAGLLCSIVAAAWFFQWQPSRWHGFWDYALFRRVTVGWQPLIRFGAVLIIVGGWLAWLYQPTIGRLFKWIKGSPT